MVKYNNNFKFSSLVKWTLFYLIKHPLEANSCRTLILGGTRKPVEIIDFIHRLQNGRNVTPSFANWKYFSIRAYINMTVQKCLKPTAPRSLHWYNAEKPNRIAGTLFSAQCTTINNIYKQTNHKEGAIYPSLNYHSLFFSINETFQHIRICYLL